LGLNYFDRNPYLSRNGTIEHREGKGTVIVIDETIDFIKKHKDGNQPLFAVAWFPSPHYPHAEVPDGPKMYEGRPHPGYYSEITLLDQQLGRLRDALRSMDIADNTILWYCSDNGGLIEWSSGGRGMKGSIYEGGLRVPSIVEWPAKKLSGRSNVTATTSDMMPTLLRMAEIEVKLPHPLDGQDLCGVIAGREQERKQGIGFWHGVGKGHKVHSDTVLKAYLEKQTAGAPLPYDKERLMLDVNDTTKVPEDMAQGHAAWNDWPYKLHRINGETYELYNLATDPEETINLVDDPAQQARFNEMKQALGDWMQSAIRSLNGEDYD